MSGGQRNKKRGKTNRSKIGAKSRRKGSKGERDIVNIHKKAGFIAERTAPMQPGLRTNNYPDVKVTVSDDTTLKIESKVDGNAPSLPFDALDENVELMFMHNTLETTDAQVLFMKIKYKGWIVCMKPELYIKLLKAYQRVEKMKPKG